MQELQVSIHQRPGEISFNFEELKEQLSAKMAEYENIAVSEEYKTFAKKDLAELRKLKESVEKRRREVKADAMLPYLEFESKVKELVQIIDRPISVLDEKLKEIEAARIRKRRSDVYNLWEEIVNDGAEYLPFDEIYDSKWNNATTNLKNVEKALHELVEKALSDISLIKESRSDVTEDALETYKKTRNLGQALTVIHTYEANKKRALEMEERRRKEEEERHHLQEIERAKAEERQKQAEIAQARKEERCRMELQKRDPDEVFLSAGEEVDELPFVQPETKTVFYKVVATEKELEQVEMAFNSIGIFYERRNV